MERDEIKRKVTRVNPHHHQLNLQEQRGRDESGRECWNIFEIILTYTSGEKNS